MNRGERLVLVFGRDGRSGRAPVIVLGVGSRTARVLRVTRQRHDTDHAPTRFGRVRAARSRLREPTTDELADPGFARLWEALERRASRRGATAG